MSALSPPPFGGDPLAPPPPPGYYPMAGSDISGKKTAAGICGIFFGALGVHKFILGYTAQGLIMLLFTIFTFGLAGIIFGIIGFIEGIIYLTKSDQDFYTTYVVNKRGWF